MHTETTSSRTYLKRTAFWEIQSIIKNTWLSMTQLPKMEHLFVVMPGKMHLDKVL